MNTFVVVVVVFTLVVVGFAMAAIFFRGRRVTRLPLLRCSHPRLVERKWLDRDGTPMVYQRCPDCDYTDQGHVHANPATWLQDDD